MFAGNFGRKCVLNIGEVVKCSKVDDGIRGREAIAWAEHWP